MSLSEQLVNKSKEAFMMAIEVYNKPTIRYRLEGFSFFICNAWELMLKAYLIKTKGEASIYYPDKPNRTISLENCIERVFTNAKSPIRGNFEKIIELRNTSTHFITEEYEMVYVPLLQACVFNFVEKMKEFHNVDMTEIIPENFITLSVRITALDETAIRAKYAEQISEHLIAQKQAITPLIQNSNSNFAIILDHRYYQTKDRNQATEFYHIAKEAEEGVRIVKELKDPSVTHKYNAKEAIKEINKRLEKNGIHPAYRGQIIYGINNYHFQLFINHFGLKNNERYCYAHMIDRQPRYTYSIQAIDFIVNEIRKDPDHILDALKMKSSKQ